MDILGKMGKVPGGIMVVPMLITAVINTIAPGCLVKIGGPVAAFCGPGTMGAIGMLLFTAGSQTRYSDLVTVCKRGGLLVLVRLIVAFVISYLVVSTYGPDGIAGASALAITCAMACCNPGVYAGLVSQYGDKIDLSAMGIINLIAVPATPLVILGIADGTGFDYMSVISTLLPFCLGMVLCNADAKLGKLFAPGTPIILFFIGCCLGSGVNLRALSSFGVANFIILALIFVLFLPINLIADKLILRRPGYAAVGATCIGGLSVVSPAIIAKALPRYAPYVEVATAQMAVTVAVSLIVIPAICKWVVAKWGDGKPAEEKAAPAK